MKPSSPTMKSIIALAGLAMCAADACDDESSCSAESSCHVDIPAGSWPTDHPFLSFSGCDFPGLSVGCCAVFNALLANKMACAHIDRTKVQSDDRNACIEAVVSTLPQGELQWIQSHRIRHDMYGTLPAYTGACRSLDDLMGQLANNADMAFSYCGRPTAGIPIKIDWNTLTDFTATYEVDMKNINTGSWPHLRGVESSTGSGTIQADVLGEKLRIRSSGSVTLVRDGEIPPTLRGDTVVGSGELVFDGVAGWAAVHARGSANHMGVALEYCVKVQVPKGLVPPPAVLQMKLKSSEPMVERNLAGALHIDVEIDGTSVAMLPVGEQGYLGLRHNGAPFGAGLVPPSNGEWSPSIKFPSWKQGAGEITGFTCGPDASTSAAELLADPNAAQTLATFDALVASLHESDSMGLTLASFPHSPSLLFQTAAPIELSTATKQQVYVTETPALSLVSVAALAAFAGVVGASLVLTALKMSSKDSRHETLLSSVA